MEESPQVNVRCVYWEHGLIEVRKHVRHVHMHLPREEGSPGELRTTSRTSLPPAQNQRTPLPWSADGQLGGRQWGKRHRCPKKWCTRENIRSSEMSGQPPSRLFSQAPVSSVPMCQEPLLTCCCVYPVCSSWSRRRSLKGESGKCYCNKPQFTPCFEGKTQSLSASQVSSLPGTGCVGNTNNNNQKETKSLNNDHSSVEDGRVLWLFMKRHTFFAEISTPSPLFGEKGYF